MCGILGIVTRSRSTDLSCVDIRALKNRGPDNVGNHVDQRVGLYHTRLAVIDKKVMSNQPLVSSCGGYALVCNGEIYNYRELRNEYRYEYKTTSDCEVILACYAAEGIQGFRNLKGMFSFGLYDKRKGVVITYRDAVGKKPLFTYQDKDTFIFSSSVTAIRDNVPVSLDLNREAISCYFKEGYVRPDISLYKAITPLLPGFLMEIDVRTGKTSSQYLTPSSTTYDSFEYTHEQIMQEAERLLTQSIQRRVDGIENLVVLFSGGVDSTVLAKKISAISGKMPICISLKPLIPLTYDDFYARYAAKRLHAGYISVGLPWSRLMKDIEDTIFLLDQPLSLYSYYLLASLTRRAKEFGNVLYLGEGGDEVFYGYSDISSWFSRERQSGLFNGCQVGPKFSLDLTPWARKQVTVELLGHSFVKVDKATAEQQMEARCPYLDWDLMHFVRGIPASYFLESGITKSILKAFLDDFPDWFVNRRKVGFAFNFRYCLAPFYRMIYQHIDFGKLSDMGVPLPPAKFTYQRMFQDFDTFWKLYVLSKFLSH